MTDRPILYSGAMVRACLDGRKTQTRRVTVQPPAECSINFMLGNESWLPVEQRSPVRRTFEAWSGDLFHAKPGKALCGSFDIVPRFQPGDRLWVRETGHAYHWDKPRAVYRADYADGATPCRVRTQIESYEVGRWTPAIHMPRWTSRLTQVVTEVRVQRLQDITEADAIAEGPGFVGKITGEVCESIAAHRLGGARWRNARDWYADLWDGLNAARGYGWATNPWVVAVTFTNHHRNIDALDAQEAA